MRKTMVRKPYNFYTQRGLRLRAQGIGRRFGKISQHIFKTALKRLVRKNKNGYKQYGG